MHLCSAAAAELAAAHGRNQTARELLALRDGRWRGKHQVGYGRDHRATLCCNMVCYVATCGAAAHVAPPLCSARATATLRALIRRSVGSALGLSAQCIRSLARPRCSPRRLCVCIGGAVFTIFVVSQLALLFFLYPSLFRHFAERGAVQIHAGGWPATTYGARSAQPTRAPTYLPRPDAVADLVAELAALRARADGAWQVH